ncbi:hypothetical protein BGZ94_006092, partial [Podila epigama]
LKKTALYTCKKGENPVLLKDCYPDRCKASKASIAAESVFVAQANDQCVDSCKCVNAGLVCGSTFPPKCQLKGTTLYKCDGSDGTPTPVEDCGAGGCTVTNGDDKCNTDDDCTCPDGTTPVCGSLLPVSCKAESNAIYVCRGGHGSKPEKLAICEPGTKCIKKDPPVGAVCGSEDCKCVGDGEVCSEGFPDECKLEKNAIYKCTPGGDPELVKKCDATQACVTLSDGAICASKDCRCPDDGTICGKVFPLSCRLKQTALYTCTKGATPILKQDCDPDGCSASKSTISAASVFEAFATEDTCIDLCLCQKAGIICGETFPERCNLDKAT